MTSRRGFSLIELAMVVGISGLMVGFVLQSQQNTASADCYATTRLQLQDINGALQRFARQKERLPLPASRSVGVEGVTYGREASGAAIDQFSGTSWGALPFQALGLNASYASDCWGNKFTYVVTTALTTNATSGGYLDATVAGNLTVKKDAATNSTTTAAYAVISHGQDALGAVKSNYTGASHGWCSGAATLKSYNCLPDISMLNPLADAAFNNGKDAGAAYFDDLIVTSGRPQILNSSNLYCWGTDTTGSGIMADNDTTIHTWLLPHQSTTPVSFAKLTDVDSLYTMTPCALTGDGTAYCWGKNSNGQIGDGTTTARTLPTLVSAATKFRNIYGLGKGMTHCGIAKDYSLWCWGFNNISMLPGTSNGNTPTPTQIATAADAQFVKILDSNGNGLCGLGKAGDVYCRGSAYQNLGNGPVGYTGSQANMTIVPGGHKFADLEGINPICGITSAADAGGAGKIYCWGYLLSGAAEVGGLGLTPAAVTGISLGTETTITYTPGTYNFSAGDGFYLQNVQGPTALNFKIYYARPGYFTANSVKLSSTSTTYTPVDTSNAGLYPAYVSGGLMVPTSRNVPTLIDGAGGITFTKMLSKYSALSNTGQIYSWGTTGQYDIGNGGSSFTPVTHSSFTASSPAVFTTAAAHGYSTGDFLFFNLNATLTSGYGRAGGITLNAGDASPNGAYVGKSIIITSGTGTGGLRVGSAYDATSKVLDITQKWSVVPDATSRYLIGTGIASQGGTTTTITLNPSASAVDNFYNGQTVGIVGGTGQSQARTITAYDGTTKVATVSAAWTAPTIASTYLIGTPVAPQTADNTSTVILAASASGTNNFYTGQTLRILSSSYTITAYDGTTKMATVTPAFSTAPTPGTAYYIGPSLDSQIFKVGATTATTFELYNLDGTPVDTTYAAQGYAGTSYKIPIDGTCFAPNAGLDKCAYTATAMTQTLLGVPYTVSDAYKNAHPLIAIGSNGMYGWGKSVNGVGVGDNTGTTRSAPVKLDVSQLLTGESLIGPIYHGANQVCMPSSLGNTYCWSASSVPYYNQLGDGTSVQKLRPTLVAGGKKFRSMSFPSSLTSSYNTAVCAIEDVPTLNCTAQTLSWTGGCSGPIVATKNGDETVVNNIAVGYSGTVTATCVNGTLQQSAASCL